MSTSPCELHELTNCGTCSGAEKKFQSSLDAPLEHGDYESLPFIPGGVTIHAKFSGTCAGCGNRWEPGTAIHRARGANDVGWVCVERCA